MSRIPVKSLVLSGAAFCLALHNAGTGLPTAQAGCGDYVHLQGTVAADMAQVQTTDSGHIGILPRYQLLPGHRPCNGPQCGKQPSAPNTPAPAPVSSMGQQQPACLIVFAAAAAHKSNRRYADPDLLTLEMANLRIDRPPRRS